MTETSTVITAPDWNAITERVACPLCDYELRGIAEPRCPECGYKFAWDELLDPARRLHPYLYEHHPERSAWSFWRTVRGGMRPGRFWRSLQPTQPSVPRRLVRYWGACVALAAVPLVGFVLWTWYDRYAMTTGQLQAAANTAIGQDGAGAALLAGVLFFLGWPWLSFLALNVFFESMFRARLRSAHVLRCVVYAGDVAVLYAAVAAVGVTVVASARLRPYDDTRAAVVLIPLAACYLVACWRLVAAYRHYMRFDRPGAAILASQVIALLAGLVVLVYVSP
jgi:hypothetical protein